jgi:hypothetical protein
LWIVLIPWAEGCCGLLGCLGAGGLAHDASFGFLILEERTKFDAGGRLPLGSR